MCGRASEKKIKTRVWDESMRVKIAYAAHTRASFDAPECAIGCVNEGATECASMVFAHEKACSMLVWYVCVNERVSASMNVCA